MGTTTENLELPAEIRAALERQIENRELELPALPEVANRVVSACFDPECDLARLVQIIETDAFMSGHLLRVTNSALYSPPRPITSLQHALSLLGLNQTRDVALRVSLEHRIFQIRGCEQRARELFEHAHDTALISRELSSLLHLEEDEAFLCGLLHDIGRPVLLQAIDDLRIRQGIKSRRRLELAPAVMEAAATEYHTEVGARLIENWNLPARFTEVPRYHHDPDAAPDPSTLTRIVCLANDLAHFTRAAFGLTRSSILEHSQLEPLGIDPAMLDPMLDRLDATLASHSR